MPNNYRIVLHQLKWNARPRRKLARWGVEVELSESLERTRSLLSSGSGPCLLVLEAREGTRAVHPAILQGQANDTLRGEMEVLWVARDLDAKALHTAQQMGASAVYAWPEGAFSHVLQWLEAQGVTDHRRVDERAGIGAWVEDSDGRRHRFVDICISGACIETDRDLPGPPFVIGEIGLVGTPAYRFIGRVVRREILAKGVQLGLRFVQIDPIARDLLARWIPRWNKATPSSQAQPLVKPELRSLDSYPLEAGTIVLHKLRFDDAKAEFLARAGFRVQTGGSVSKTLTLLDQAEHARALVVDLNTGGNAPEKLLKETLSRSRVDGRPPPMLIAAGSRRGIGRLRHRAYLLGLEAAYVWPEGLFAELVDRILPPATSEVERVAPRAPLRQAFEDEAGKLHGRILNISATGALVELNQKLSLETEVRLRLSVPGGCTAMVDAVVRWCAPSGSDLHRAGVQFKRISSEMREGIGSFVRHYNVLHCRPVARPVPDPSRSKKYLVRASPQGGTRKDYFLWAPDAELCDLLVPRRPFFVPYQVGDRLALRAMEPAPFELAVVEVVERQLLEPDRIDARVAWRVRKVG